MAPGLGDWPVSATIVCSTGDMLVGGEPRRGSVTEVLRTRGDRFDADEFGLERLGGGTARLTLAVARN